jgi:heme/copper-type cytochrome/quinol oxidase subunit 2
MTTQIWIFLLVVTSVFGVLLYASIKNNKRIKQEKEKEKVATEAFS